MGQSGETEIFESKAARVVRHKEFSQQTLHKDVAIITMAEPVPASYTKIASVLAQRTREVRPAHGYCHRLGKSQGERTSTRHTSGDDCEDLGQQRLQGDVRQFRPRRHHGPHALRWAAGQGLLQW